MLEEVAALKDITKRQEHLIAELNHALHGKRSERLSEDELQLAFEDLSIALAEVDAAKEIRAAKAGNGAPRPAPKRTIGNLPAALPRVEVVIELVRRPEPYAEPSSSKGAVQAGAGGACQAVDRGHRQAMPEGRRHSSWP